MHPPAEGLVFLEGPIATLNDGINNNHNGFVDEVDEQAMLSGFVCYLGVGDIPNGRMSFPVDYYQYMTSTWLDGQPITYGGNERDPGNGNTGTPCKFMFAGTSDPLFTQDWNMPVASILPDDMRFIMSAGSFTMAPGAVSFMSFSAIFARDYADTTNMLSVALLKHENQKIKNLFTSCFTLTGLSLLQNTLRIHIGENPFINSCSIDLSPVKGTTLTYKVYTVSGQLVEEKIVTPGGMLSIGSSYNSGTYIITFASPTQKYSAKILKK